MPAATTSDPQGVRLHKAIAMGGVASRREAERLIEAGRVRVNGAVVRRLGSKVDPARDRVEVNGRPVPLERTPAREVWALYKPRRVVCTLHDPEGRATIRDYFPRTPQRLFPVGRLDYDAEGLILLTNDGDLAQKVAHPSHSVPRIYLVKVKGLVEPAALRELAHGPVLQGRRLRPFKARILHTVHDKTWCELILREGVHHQIKRMFEGIGHRVLKIKRYQIGPVALADMRPGQVRRLGREEVAALLGA